MRLLVAIPHYYKAADGTHGSSSVASRGRRIQALSEAILAMHQLLGPGACEIDIARKTAIPLPCPHTVDIVVCTTGSAHLVADLPLRPNLFQHHPTQAEPLMLGFECHAVLREYLGQYDFYAFLEDDLVIHDSLFLEKLTQFNRFTPLPALLQPNRYEISGHGPFTKAYVDGVIRHGATSAFQDVSDEPTLQGQLLGLPVRFRRPLNPHAGCFFLSQEQMAYWVSQPHFLDRDVRFISPLESAATLGLMKTFRIYKPDRVCANFLEIRHADPRFIPLIGHQVVLDSPKNVPQPVG
jgi:hypothetical protein